MLELEQQLAREVRRINEAGRKRRRKRCGNRAPEERGSATAGFRSLE
jgi:hypothetical protein